MGFAIMACGVFIGGPGAGAILGSAPTRSSFTGVSSPLPREHQRADSLTFGKKFQLWILGGVCALVAAAAFIALRTWRTQGKLMARA